MTISNKINLRQAVVAGLVGTVVVDVLGLVTGGSAVSAGA